MLNSKYNQDPRLAHAVYLWFQAYVAAVVESREVWRVSTHRPGKPVTNPPN